MKPDRLQNGDLMLKSGHGPLERLIQWYTGMVVWTRFQIAKMRGKTFCYRATSKPLVFDHIGIISFKHGKPIVIEAKFGKGVIETPLIEYTNKKDITVKFYRILMPVTGEPINEDAGAGLVDMISETVGAKYDWMGAVGFIRIFIHKVFKFIPIKNPFDDPSKFWCSEAIREGVIRYLHFDLYQGIPEDFESPNDTVTTYLNGTRRVVELNTPH